jgi:hypothetical protein
MEPDRPALKHSVAQPPPAFFEEKESDGEQLTPSKQGTRVAPKIVQLSATAIDELIQRQKEPKIPVESETRRPFVPPFFQQIDAGDVSGVRKAFDMVLSEDHEQDVRNMEAARKAEDSAKLDFTE